MASREEAQGLLAEKIGLGEVTQHAVACGTCGAPMRLVAAWDEVGELSIFYGCSKYPKCKSTHGAHPDGRPLGIPGDAPTRAARIRAHEAFDRLWANAARMYPDLPEDPAEKVAALRRLDQVARSRAYAWLAERMQLPLDDCHVGAFDVATCELVVLLCDGKAPEDIRAWAKAKRETAPQPPPTSDPTPDQGKPARKAPRGKSGRSRGHSSVDDSEGMTQVQDQLDRLTR